MDLFSEIHFLMLERETRLTLPHYLLEIIYFFRTCVVSMYSFVKAGKPLRPSLFHSVLQSAAPFGTKLIV